METIGDAWMGVTNLENDQEYTHVKLIAEMAVDMVLEAKKVLIDEDDPNRGYVNIRVGFHSGVSQVDIGSQMWRRIFLMSMSSLLHHRLLSPMSLDPSINVIVCLVTQVCHFHPLINVPSGVSPHVFFFCRDT